MLLTWDFMMTTNSSRLTALRYLPNSSRRASACGHRALGPAFCRWSPPALLLLAPRGLILSNSMWLSTLKMLKFPTMLPIMFSSSSNLASWPHDTVASAGAGRASSASSAPVTNVLPRAAWVSRASSSPFAPSPASCPCRSRSSPTRRLSSVPLAPAAKGTPGRPMRAATKSSTARQPPFAANCSWIHGNRSASSLRRNESSRARSGSSCPSSASPFCPWTSAAPLGLTRGFLASDRPTGKRGCSWLSSAVERLAFRVYCCRRAFMTGPCESGP
mmetsp:Transcript_94574/g.267314  ORF Transcript_94574/g.267314 Transcript_94574/m.267314 type:complete len:274 (-) Transcript_94574:331-1152(-)